MRSVQWYDWIAALYDRASLGDSFYLPARRVALDRLRAGDHVVLDLFCGTGANFPLLLSGPERARKVVGMDGSAGMLDRARSRLRRLGVPDQHVELTRADFDTPDGIDVVREVVYRLRPHRYLFTLGLTCLPNWREFFGAVFDAAPEGSRFVILDVHSPEMTPGARLINWIGAADCRRPVWKELESRSGDFRQEAFRPFRLIDVSVALSSGTKAGASAC